MKLVVLAIVALAAAAPQTPTPAQTPDAHARAIIDALVAGHYDVIEAQYNAAMKAALPPGALKTSWASATVQFGAFESVTSVTTATAGSTQIVTAICRFANDDVTLRFAFSAAGELAGLTSINVVDRTPWAPAAYVNAASFDERPITVHSGHWDLPGFVTVPKTPGSHPAVVLVHGSGPNDADEAIGPNKVFRDLAYGLASRGVVVIRYDKRTYKYKLASSDNPAAFTVKEEEMDDASAAVALLGTMPEVNRAKIFVAGHSEGGYLAPRIAKADPAVKGLILLAGNVRPLDVMLLEQVNYQAKQAGQMTPAIQQVLDEAKTSAAEYDNPDLKPGMTVQVLGAALPASYVLDLRTYDPAAVAASLTIPMLVLQGERDYQVTMTDFGLWKQALAGHANVTFKSYPALNHLFFAGTGPSMPVEYAMPNHVDGTVVADIAAWCLK